MRWPSGLSRPLRRSRSRFDPRPPGGIFLRTSRGDRRASAAIPHPRGMAETYGCPIRNSAKTNTHVFPLPFQKPTNHQYKNLQYLLIANGHSCRAQDQLKKKIVIYIVVY